MTALRVDPLLSYARRAGGDIKLVLVVAPAEEPISTDVLLRLHDDEAVDHPVSLTSLEDGRTRVQATIPTGTLREGTWRMKFVSPGDQRMNLQTRLLIRSGMPIALLPGVPPRTRLPEPSPRR